MIFNPANNLFSTIESTFAGRYFNQVRRSNIQCGIITNGFNDRAFTAKCGPKVNPHLFDIYFLTKIYFITAAAFKFNTLIKAIEIRSNTQCQYNHGNNISHFTVFNEFEFGMFENTTGYTGKIFEVTFFVGKPFSDPAAHQDTAE